MNTCSNPQPLPLAQFKPGDIYQHSTVNQLIIRVDKVGHALGWGDKVLPECIEFTEIGWLELVGRWWENDKRGQPSQDTADRIYFFPWNGNGILFGTAKWRKLEALLQQRFEIGLKLRGYEHAPGPAGKKIYRQAVAADEKWQAAVDTLFATPATNDPKIKPAIILPPPAPPIKKLPPRTKTTAWSQL